MLNVYEEKFGIEEGRVNIEGAAEVFVEEFTHPRIVLTTAGGVVVAGPPNLLTELVRTT